MKEAIDQSLYDRGKTNTAWALQVIREQGFHPLNGDRPDVPNIAVLFTDGGSSNFDATVEQARLAHLTGITILVVVLSDWYDDIEVGQIASDPDERSIFLLNNIDDIHDIQMELQTILCCRK